MPSAPRSRALLSFNTQMLAWAPRYLSCSASAATSTENRVCIAATDRSAALSYLFHCCVLVALRRVLLVCPCITLDTCTFPPVLFQGVSMVSTPATPPTPSNTASAPLTQDQFNAFVQSTYGRYPLTIVRGDGCKLFDSNGKVWSRRKVVMFFCLFQSEQQPSPEELQLLVEVRVDIYSYSSSASRPGE